MAEIGEAGSLGVLLEQDYDIRDIGRSNRQITQWPTPETVGVPSCQAIACNLRLIHLVLEWWAAHQPKPKTIPVPVIKEEVGGSQIEFYHVLSVKKSCRGLDTVAQNK